jgi:hypothetical protein
LWHFYFRNRFRWDSILGVQELLVLIEEFVKAIVFRWLVVDEVSEISHAGYLDPAYVPVNAFHE